MRIASSMVRPAVVSFLDEMLRTDDKLRVEEIVVPPDYDPRRARRGGAARARTTSLLAVRAAGGWQFNPPGDLALQPGNTLVVMATPEGRRSSKAHWAPAPRDEDVEHAGGYLIQTVVFFASAVLAVVLSHRLGLGLVAGYLLAGIAIGPFGMKLVDRTDDVRHIAELGVVFLLFVIGLELEPKRLWNMRARLLSLGLAQVAGSIPLIAGAAWLAGIDVRIGIVAGMALALSSTALALQPLTERGALQNKGGQSAFAILLFQDIAVIPMLALLPLLGATGSGSSFSWGGLGFALAVVAATLVGGHFLARPVFRHIARIRQREIFTAFALLLVLGIAWGFESAGLSMALGTFLAGVLLAESEYRHEIEAAVEPFKGLLLGLFFIAVGMGVDFSLLFETADLHPRPDRRAVRAEGRGAVGDRARRHACRAASCRCSSCCSRRAGSSPSCCSRWACRSRCCASAYRAGDDAGGGAVHALDAVPARCSTTACSRRASPTPRPAARARRRRPAR